MKKQYFLVPVVLLAGFLLLERDHNRTRTENACTQASQAAAANAAEAARLESSRHKTVEDIRLRHEAREALERERVAEKLRHHATVLRTIDDQAAAHSAAAGKLADESAVLEGQLAEVRGKLDALGRDSLELALQIESQRAARRRAELQLVESTSRFAAHLHQNASSILFPHAW